MKFVGIHSAYRSQEGVLQCRANLALRGMRVERNSGAYREGLQRKMAKSSLKRKKAHAT